MAPEPEFRYVPPPPKPTPTDAPPSAPPPASRPEPRASGAALLEAKEIEREFSAGLYEFATRFAKNKRSQDITDVDMRDAQRILLIRPKRSWPTIAGQSVSRLAQMFSGAMVGIGAKAEPTQVMTIIGGVMLFVAAAVIDELLLRYASK